MSALRGIDELVLHSIGRLGTWAGSNEKNRHLHMLIEKGQNDGSVLPTQEWGGLKAEIKQDVQKVHADSAKKLRVEEDASHFNNRRIMANIDAMQLRMDALENSLHDRTARIDEQMGQILTLLRPPPHARA